MYEFRGIDLSTKYIPPYVWEWLVVHRDDPDAPEYYFYDDGHGCILFTYSFDENDADLPEPLREIIREAYQREWRFVVFDSDGADCELFDDYLSSWPV